MIACSACRATSSRARPRVFEVSWCGPTNKERPRHLSFHSHTGGFHRRCKKPPTHSHAAEAQPFDSRRTREQYCGRRSHSSLTPRSPVAPPSWPRSSRRPARSSSRRDVRRRMARDCSSSKGITIFRRWILFRANRFCCIVTNAYFYFRYTTLVGVKKAHAWKTRLSDTALRTRLRRTGSGMEALCGNSVSISQNRKE